MMGGFSKYDEAAMRRYDAPYGYPDQWLSDPWGPEEKAVVPFFGREGGVWWSPRFRCRIVDVEIVGEGKLESVGFSVRQHAAADWKKYCPVVAPGEPWMVYASGKPKAAIITFRESVSHHV